MGCSPADEAGPTRLGLDLGKRPRSPHTETMSAQGNELEIVPGPVAGAVTLLLNRPTKKNALSRDLVLTLGDALERLAQDDEIRVLVLRGRGGAFCSGADLRTIVDAEHDEIEGRIDEFHRLIRGVVTAPQPVIAVVDGPAVGFGADLALCCDMRVFTEAGYLEEGFIKVGLMPDGGGTYFMPHFVGPRAFEYLALGTRLSAPHCEELGIANRVVAPAELEPLVDRWAASLCAAAPLALGRIKQALRREDLRRLDETLAVEKSGQTGLVRSGDFQEGVRAFLERRPAQFRGK